MGPRLSLQTPATPWLHRLCNPMPAGAEGVGLEAVCDKQVVHRAGDRGGSGEGAPQGANLRGSPAGLRPGALPQVPPASGLPPCPGLLALAVGSLANLQANKWVGQVVGRCAGLRAPRGTRTLEAGPSWAGGRPGFARRGADWASAWEGPAGAKALGAPHKEYKLVRRRAETEAGTRPSQLHVKHSPMWQAACRRMAIKVPQEGSAWPAQPGTGTFGARPA